MHSRRNARTWIQRGLLATLVGAVLVFGLRANGSVASELSTLEGSVWLVDPPLGVLVQVNALAKDVTASVKVADRQQQLAASQVGSGAIVLNRSTSAVGRVDGSVLEYQSGRKLASAGADLALVGSDGGVFAVDTSDGKLIALDRADLSTRYEATVTPQQSIPTVVDSRGRLWAFDAAKGELVRFDGATGQVKRSSVAKVNTNASLALVGDRPVLVDGGRGEVVRIDADGSAGAKGCLADKTDAALMVTGTPPAEEQSRVYALSPETGTLWTSGIGGDDCKSLQVNDEENRGSSDGFGAPVVSDGRLFVPVFARSQVLVVSPEGTTIERTVDLRTIVSAGNRFELFEHDGRLWFNDLEGPKAGVLTAAGPTLIVDKTTLQAISGDNLTNASTSDDAPSIGVQPKVPGNGTGSKSTGDATSGDQNAGQNLDPTSPKPGDPPAPNASGATRPGSSAEPSSASPGASQSPTPSTIPSSTGPGASGSGPEKKPAPATVVQPSDSDALVANFVYSPPGDPTTETSLTFTDTSVGKINQWTWTFTAPDGTTSTATGRTLSRTLSSVGAWTVTLTVSGDGAKSDTTRPLAIQVRDPSDLGPPTANFSWDPATPVVRQEVVFKDRSSASKGSPITSWLWEFGDGTSSTLQNPPAKVYATPGTYAVHLTVKNSQGVNATEATLKVAEPPAPLKPDFTYAVGGVTGAEIAAGQTVLFTDNSTGGPTAWSWDFGDGSIASTPAVVHAFRVPGDFKVKLVVSNANGSQSVVKTLKVNVAAVAPQAKISEPASGITVEVNKPLRFVSGSTGGPTQLLWDWGDGTTSEGVTVTHSFAHEGPVGVKLRATNGAGASETSILVTVTATPAPPLVAGFRLTPGASPADLAIVGEAVRFTNTSTGVGTFVWNFGDGSTSNERDPSYAYKKVGTFHVTLTMSANGRAAVATHDVYVGPAPVEVVANFDYTPKNPNVNQPVVFADRTTGTPARWAWNFGDGSATFNGQTPAPKAYAAAGKYDVTLTVVDRNGVVTVKTATITVTAVAKAPPAASFSISPATAKDWVAGKPLLFTDTTAAAGQTPLTTPVFTFEGAPVSPAAGSRSVEHIFATPGSYPVSMKVCWVDDPTNCTVKPQTIEISPSVAKPVAAFEVSGAGVMPGTNPPLLIVGFPVTFLDRSTGAVTTYDWTIKAEKFTSPTVTVSLASGGTLSVTLTVANSAGSSTVTRDFQVLPGQIQAAFSSPNTADVGTSVHFTDSSTVPSQGTRTWDFGDGSGALAGGPGGVDHSFAAPGTYNVKLTVALNGATSVATRAIVVKPGAPTPRIQATNQTTGTQSAAQSITATVGDTVSFTDTATTPAVDSRLWIWSDGAPGGTGATVARTFTAAGTYSVTVQATNGSGTSSASMAVIVAPAPTTTTTSTTTTTTTTTTTVPPTTTTTTIKPPGAAGVSAI